MLRCGGCCWVVIYIYIYDDFAYIKLNDHGNILIHDVVGRVNERYEDRTYTSQGYRHVLKLEKPKAEEKNVVGKFETKEWKERKRIKHTISYFFLKNNIFFKY